MFYKSELVSLCTVSPTPMVFCPMTFQDPATPIMEGMINFHNLTMFYLILVGSLVLWMLYRSFDYYQGLVFAANFSYPCAFEMDFSKPKLNLGSGGPWSHSTNLEVIWTLFPAVILVLIGLPSFSLLYSLEEILDPSLSVKAIGHQWYWSYEYSDYNQKQGKDSLQFDSYMKAENDLGTGEFRLLEVDNRLVLPTNTHLRLLVTSADVLHSWAVPSLGVKVDACPGRLNQVCIYLKRPGVFYGQCSEICGKSHGFMPIVIEAVSLDTYLSHMGLGKDIVDIPLVSPEKPNPCREVFWRDHYEELGALLKHRLDKPKP